VSRCGFVALIGRPNAGKSTLLNAILGEKIALVSQKANATRKRQNAIVMHDDSQIIFVDTPGLHEMERRLNQFMLEEALKAIGDCDLVVYLAPVTDKTEHYRKFLELNGDRKHIIVLSKIDQVSQERLLKCISGYSEFASRFEALIPISIGKRVGFDDLLGSIVKLLPQSEYLYDPDDLTTDRLRDIYKEFIREAIFDNISDEIPYSSDVIIKKIDEGRKLDHIEASIVVEKESQKGIIIGKNGSAIKRIGRSAREKIEALSQKKLFLDLSVIVKPNWTKETKSLEEFGYFS